MLRRLLQNKKELMYWGVFLIAVVLFFFPELAEAAEDGKNTGTSGITSGGDPWHELGDRAQSIGFGLKKVGYIIAGLGLITVSFMAIFNKISWKSLWYIFLSCFTLTAMTAVVNTMTGKTPLTYENYLSSSGSTDYSSVAIENVDTVVVDKEETTSQQGAKVATQNGAKSEAKK